MYDRLVPLSTGHSTSTHYAQLISRSSGEFWDGANVVLSSSFNYADTVIALTEISSSGVLGFIAPTDLPAGKIYLLIVRLQAGASPANTDNIVASQELRWGGGFGF